MNRNTVYRLRRFVRKNLPTILTWASALSTAGALYFTGKATVKAVRKYDEIKKENKDASKKEILKAVVPYYIPAAGFTAAAITCTFSSNHINVKRQRVLAGALLASNEAFHAFRKKAMEKIGQEEILKIDDEQKKEEVEKATSPDEIITVYDEFTGYSFNTTYEKLLDAEKEVNRRLNGFDGGYVCNGTVELNEFYYLLGAKRTKFASEYSWNAYDMTYCNETSWVDFTNVKQRVNPGKSDSCYVLYYYPEPKTELELKDCN